jgi:hypothetical protein
VPARLPALLAPLVSLPVLLFEFAVSSNQDEETSPCKLARMPGAAGVAGQRRSACPPGAALVQEMSLRPCLVAEL